MVLFERFIARRSVDLKLFFEATGIKSDAELRAYCTQKGMTMPTKKYFKESKASKKKPPVLDEVASSPLPPKSKVTRKPRTTKAKAKTTKAKAKTTKAKT